MLFFKKKKLIEIENKLDSVLVQLKNSNKSCENMQVILLKIEKRLDLLEEKIDMNQKTVSQIVNETETAVLAEVTNLRDYIKMFDDTMEDLSEKNVAEILSKIQLVVDGVGSVKDNVSTARQESIAELSNKISQTGNQLQKQIIDGGNKNRVGIETLMTKLDALSKIENRLYSIEEKNDNTRKIAYQNVDRVEKTVMAEANKLSERLKKLDDMEDLSEKTIAEIVSKVESLSDELYSAKDNVLTTQQESVATLNEKINKLCEQLRQLIIDNGAASCNKAESIVSELDDKLDMVDSSLRLLLLNSVMDQIKE